MKKYEEIYNLIDYQAKVLVGTLLKRIEVLEKEKVFTPKLYKALVKEQIYEQFRNLKKLIEVTSEIGKLEFKSREE